MPAALFANGPSTGLGVGIINTTVAIVKALLEPSSRIVNSTSTALTLTSTEHAERIIYWKPNSSGAATATLPAATGSGQTYRLINGLVQTQGTVVVTARTGELITGKALMFDTTASADAGAFKTTATSIKFTLNLTTQGGLGFDELVATDVSTGLWLVEGKCIGSGSLQTPFSA